jgi:membrane protease YdiL (CAAX protease family)
MKKFSAFATRHPLLFGFILILLFSILSTFTWPITQTYPTPEGYEVGSTLAKLVIAACFLFILWRFGWLEAAGFISLGHRRIWFLGIVLVVYKAILNVFAFTGSFKFSLPEASLPAAILFFTLATSLLEETMYRGLLLTAMVKAWGGSRRGLFAAAILSGLFWASLHFFNLLVRPFPLVALQVLSMVMVGFFYTALVLSGRSIWPAVFIHWATNAAVNLQVSQIPNFTETTTVWGILFLANLLLVAVGVYLMMRLQITGKSIEPALSRNSLVATKST